MDAIVYQDPNDRKRNRGFCFLEYETHKAASAAKRKLISNRIKVWGVEVLADWAEPLEEPDEETMAKVKVRKLLIILIISFTYGPFYPCLGPVRSQPVP